MHPTAMVNAKHFFDTYLDPAHSGYFTIEIGSLIVPNMRGSLREIAPANVEYVGIDFEAGQNVDVVLDDPYRLPFENQSVDICLASSVFEHSEMFWLLFLEIMRILKPDGLFYLNVPSNGYFHRYPVDCWRFYPDSAEALVTWGKRNSLEPALLESYVSAQSGDVWNDFVAVFVKDRNFASKYPGRITSRISDFINARLFGTNEIVNRRDAPEDLLKLQTIGKIASGNLKIR